MSRPGSIFLSPSTRYGRDGFSASHHETTFGPKVMPLGPNIHRMSYHKSCEFKVDAPVITPNMAPYGVEDLREKTKIHGYGAYSCQ